MSLAWVLLSPPQKQDNSERSLPAVVDPVPRTEIDPQLRDTAPYGFAVSKIAQPDPIETSADNTTHRGIPQRSKPPRKRSRLARTIEENLNLPSHSPQ